MTCNMAILPKFTKKQIAECKDCMHASGKKIWCCHFGEWIVKPSPIVYPSKISMAKNLITETAKYITQGRPKRSDEEINRIMIICRACPEFVTESRIGARCKKCGCCTKIKTTWATADCPLNKW